MGVRNQQPCFPPVQPVMSAAVPAAREGYAETSECAELRSLKRQKAKIQKAREKRKAARQQAAMAWQQVWILSRLFNVHLSLLGLIRARSSVKLHLSGRAVIEAAHVNVKGSVCRSFTPAQALFMAVHCLSHPPLPLGHPLAGTRAVGVGGCKD